MRTFLKVTNLYFPPNKRQLMSEFRDLDVSNASKGFTEGIIKDRDI